MLLFCKYLLTRTIKYILMHSHVSALCHSLTCLINHSLPNSLTPSLSHFLTQSLLSPLTHSLTHPFTPSLPPSLPPPLPPSPSFSIPLHRHSCVLPIPSSGTVYLTPVRRSTRVGRNKDTPGMRLDNNMCFDSPSDVTKRLEFEAVQLLPNSLVPLDWRD